MMSLSLSLNKIQEIRGGPFPPTIRRGSISYGNKYIKIVDLEEYKPHQELRIETLFSSDVDLSDFKLFESLQRLHSEIHSELDQLRNLYKFLMGDNTIPRVVVDFHTNSLKMLDLSRNSIEERSNCPSQTV